MNIKLKDGGIKAKVFALAAAITFSGAVAFVPFAAVAQQASSDLIQQLTAQIAALQAQLQALSGGGASTAGGGAGACTFTRDLSMGVKGDDVMCLQKYLNGSGYQVAASGAGSPGNETTYFGGKTKAAVKAWQAANGVSPVAGYFGAKSRAKYETIAMPSPAPAPVPTPTPTPGPTPPPGTPPPAPVGSGLTVAASGKQPDATLAPVGAARVPFTKAVFTASSDGDVTVKSVTVERQGLADDAAFDSIVLVDENGLQVGLSKTLNANHQVMLNDGFVVKAGTSREMTIGGNMETSSNSKAGQVAYLAIVKVDAGTSAVNGTLPIKGNGMTINESLTIGSLASPARGVLDPGAAQSSLQIGTNGFYASGIRWTVGSGEAVLLEQVRWYQAGSAATGDLANVKVTVGSTDYPATVSSDGKYYIAKFSPSIRFDKGANIDIAVKADVAGGSGRTINFDIQRRTDVVAKGELYGFYIIPANGSSAASADSGAVSSNEPYYDGYAHTISKGSLRVEKSNVLPAQNVAVGASNVPLGAFTIEGKGEPVQISSFKITFNLSSGETGSEITGVSVYDQNGNVMAGPKDVGSDKTVTLTDTWTVPPGLNTYTVKGKISTAYTDGGTIQASSTPSTDITAKGQVTGLTITPTPSSGVTANTQTIRKASLKVSMSTVPSAQTVVRGINGFLFSKIQYDAGASGEDLRISAEKLTITVSGSANPNNLNNCVMYDGATALNTGSNVISPTTGTAGTNLQQTFTLDNTLIVPKGTVKLVDVKCNIDSNATAGQTWSIGTAQTTDTPTVVGKDTGTSVTATLTTGAGSTMTVQSGGTIAVSADTSYPSARLAMFGKTDNVVSVFRFDSTNEDINITKFGFNLASTTGSLGTVVAANATASTSDVVKLTFWDGATKVGEGIFSGSAVQATSTFTSNFIVPKDSYKLLTVKADLVSTNSSVGKAAKEGEDSGHTVIINYDGQRSTATEGIGQSSGTKINPTVGNDPSTSGKGLFLVKTIPTVARLAVPTNTLSTGDMSLYRFSVTADPSGDVGLYMVRFNVSRPNSATTSQFRLYAYTDSAFSTQAYAQNPINVNDVDCVGSSSLSYAANGACSTNVPGTTASASGIQNVKYVTAASSSLVTINFDPVTNTPAAPNAEAINIPAGQTRYFELKGQVSATTTDTLTVNLLGDAVPRQRTDNSAGTDWSANSAGSGTATAAGTPSNENSTLLRDTLWNADRVATSSNFVWSPNTTSTSATTTNDWLTGYLVPGLPSAGLSAQTFVK